MIPKPSWGQVALWSRPNQKAGFLGKVAKRTNAAGCKPVLYEFPGSNPGLATMPFPWEVDYNPRPKTVKRRRKAVAKGRNNYKKFGHPKWYDEYLKTPHWRAFKIKWRSSGRSRRCTICGDPRYELHHTTYARIGRELLDDVIPLCRGHHSRAHKREKEGVALSAAHL